MKEIKLYRDKVTKVDDDMYEYLSQWKWGFDGRYAYRREILERLGPRKIKYKKIYLQKVVNQTPDGMDTDHINCDKLDNRKENLRSVTRSQNNANMPKIAKKCSSRFKGVCWHKQRGKWKAEIKLNGVKKHLGVFLTEEEAAEAYNKAALERFGNHARLNTGD